LKTKSTKSSSSVVVSDTCEVSLPEFNYYATYDVLDDGTLVKDATQAEIDAFVKLKKDEVYATHLEHLKSTMSASVRSRFDQYVDLRSDFELSTFDIQYSELCKYKASNNAVTPYCSALAKHRGIKLSVLMGQIESAISKKAKHHADCSEQLRKLWEAKTITEVEAIASTVI